MKANETRLDKVRVAAGSCMFFCGAVMLSPLGFLLLIGLFYAMLAQDFALGLLITIIVCAPIIFGVIWAVLACIAALREHFALVPKTALVTITHRDA